MGTYNVWNYRRFEDYQHGHGEKIFETSSKQEAINCANSSTYGGREICNVTKDDVEIYSTLD